MIRPKLSQIFVVGIIFVLAIFYAKFTQALCSPQCLEYVQSQTNIGGPYGDANGAWENAPGNNGWRSVVSGGDENPSVGDVLYWDIGEYGHVGMIRRVVGNTVYIEDRNWNEQCGSRSDVLVSLDNEDVVGWLTNNPITPPQNEHEVDTTAYAKSGNLAWLPLDVKCQDAKRWVDIATGSVIADKSVQSVYDPGGICENYGILPQCKM